MNWKIMNLKQFRNHAQELFYRKSTGPVNQPERLISFVTILFEQTVLKGRKWIGRDEVARLQYEKNDGKDYLERVKQSEKRLRTRLNELEADGREIGFRFLDNKETGNVVSNSKGRPTRGYRLELIGKTANATTKSDGIHLGKFAGRDEQVSQFRELLDRFDDPSRERHVLPFYGFGGVGESSLLEILRNIASCTTGYLANNVQTML